MSCTKILFIKHSSQFFSWNKWNEYLKNEIGNQLSWFEERIDISETKITNEKGCIVSIDIIEKLKLIYSKIDQEKIKKRLNNLNKKTNFEAQAPSYYTGSYVFKCKVVLNDISLVLEVDTSDNIITSYGYTKGDNKVLKEKFEAITKYKTYDYNEIPEDIASKITKQLEDLIDIIGKEII